MHLPGSLANWPTRCPQMDMHGPIIDFHKVFPMVDRTYAFPMTMDCFLDAFRPMWPTLRCTYRDLHHPLYKGPFFSPARRVLPEDTIYSVDGLRCHKELYGVAEIKCGPTAPCCARCLWIACCLPAACHALCLLACMACSRRPACRAAPSLLLPALLRCPLFLLATNPSNTPRCARRDYAHYVMLYDSVRRAVMTYRAYYYESHSTGHLSDGYNKVLDYESWCFVNELEYCINDGNVKFNYLCDYGTAAFAGESIHNGIINMADSYRKNMQSVLDHICAYQGYADGPDGVPSTVNLASVRTLTETMRNQKRKALQTMPTDHGATARNKNRTLSPTEHDAIIEALWEPQPQLFDTMKSDACRMYAPPRAASASLAHAPVAYLPCRAVLRLRLPNHSLHLVPPQDLRYPDPAAHQHGHGVRPPRRRLLRQPFPEHPHRRHAAQSHCQRGQGQGAQGLCPQDQGECAHRDALHRPRRLPPLPRLPHVPAHPPSLRGWPHPHQPDGHHHR